MSELPKIVAAAVRHGGTVVSLPRPARHHDIIHMLYDRGNRKLIRPEDQGFITSEERYVDREEAAHLAVASGQIEGTRWGRYLFSEDLW